MKELAPQSPVERTVNYEGNESVLLFSRLHNPAIREQLIEFIFSAETELQGEVTRNREQIEADLDARIAQIEHSTNIAYAASENHPFHTAARMVIGSVDPITKSKLTVKQNSISEAHEKGHVVRDYSGTNKETYAERLSSAFDTSHFEIPKKEWDLIKENHKDVEEPLDIEGIKKEYLHYLLDPSEVVERMSQLKNYFGFGGSEVFTLEHLNYAKEHYVRDVGTDNGMSSFFTLITADTEQEFLRIINSVGV